MNWAKFTHVVELAAQNIAAMVTLLYQPSLIVVDGAFT